MWECTRCLKAALRSRSKLARASSMFTAASTGAAGSAASASLLLSLLLFLLAALSVWRPAAAPGKRDPLSLNQGTDELMKNSVQKTI